MNKNLNQNLVWIFILVLIVFGVYWLSGSMPATQNGAATTSPDTVIGIKDISPAAKPGVKAPSPKSPILPIGAVTNDYRNATYIIEGTPVKLVNGMAITSTAPGSAEKVTTQYFGDGSAGDLNGDGKDDTAFLLTQSTGGSGTFYYIAAAIKTSSGYTGTNAYLIGDRISPQNTNISKGIIVVNYAERKPGEPMTAIPSVGQSKYFKLTNGTLFAINPPAQVNY